MSSPDHPRSVRAMLGPLCQFTEGVLLVSGLCFWLLVAGLLYQHLHGGLAALVYGSPECQVLHLKVMDEPACHVEPIPLPSR